MKSAAVLSLAALAGAAKLSGEPDLTGYDYKRFLEEHGKGYSTTFEMAKREQIFNENMKEILAQNAKEDKTWFAAPNKFTDMTNEEFKATGHGHYPHKEGAFEKADLSGFKVEDLPDSVDWREHDGVVTAVKDQGGCGSCWAFSVTETMESQLAIATGNPAPILSPQQVVSCAPNPDHCGGSGGCDGSTQPLGFNYTMSAGQTTEESYPYTARTGTCDESKIKPVAQNGGFKSLTTNSYTELATAVANVGPVAISVAAGGFGWQIYGGGVYTDGGDYVMDHAVGLVGYGVDGDKMYWTVRNSWGSGWGENGYIRLQRFGEGNEPCGMDNNPQDGDACAGDTDPREYCGMCGILSASAYPTDMKAL